MPTLYRDTGYTLNHLIDDIRMGRIALPDIQRPFVWKSSKVRDLFDSMYRGYPVGTLMLWETGADVGTRQIGMGETDRASQLLIVDGQQRLTSLYAVMAGQEVLSSRFEPRKIRIAFRPSDETFEVTDAAIGRNPEFISDITTLWTQGYKSTIREFFRELKEARGEDLTDEYKDLLEERIDRVRDLRDFRFQIIELSASADEEQVAEIFVRINSEGVQLNQADFILTLMSVHWEKGRRALEEFARDAISPTGSGASAKNPFVEPSPDQMLRVAVGLAFNRARLQHVYSLLRGKDLSTGEISTERRDDQFAQLAAAQEKVLDLTNWHEFLKCLQTAGFRSNKMISSTNALLFSYLVWLIGRERFGIPLPELRPVIARWFFMAHTTGRYTSSPEAQVESDLNRIADLGTDDQSAFIDELDRIVRANFTNDYWEITLPNRLDTSSSRSPALSAYHAALQLLDADALFSKVKLRDLMDPAVTAPRSIERHHLFPKKYLESIGITSTRQVNSIANMAYLDWNENSTISNQPPYEYWSAMSQLVTAQDLERQRHLHALPLGWEQLDYSTFLERRRVLISRIIREGFNTLWQEDTPRVEMSAAEMIAAGESQTCEFKSTLRWNVKANQMDREMEMEVVRTVCAFLNAEGGSLFIGVDDDGQVLGLDDDLKTLGRKQDLDGFELRVRELLETSLSTPTALTVRISFPTVDSKVVCLVSVAASGQPVFAQTSKDKGGPTDKSEFWVRTGNGKRQLHGDDLITYRDEHWG